MGKTIECCCGVEMYLCTKPSVSLKEYLASHLLAIRVFKPAKGESRSTNIGIFAVTIMVSMLVTFVLWNTSPVCKLQSECTSACVASPPCIKSQSHTFNMTIYSWEKPQNPNSHWDKCFKTAEKWNPSHLNVCFDES